MVGCRTLAADSLPQLSVSCHLVPVVADVVQAFLRASGDVQHALVRNNRTRAGDEPDIRTSLRCALRELDRIGRAVSNVELFLRAQRQPILQELAVALATASSHASETCRVAPLLLTAASIMQACARQLAAKGCADSTRSFLLNVSLQFDACCQARDWRMLQALVDIHGMLRFGVGRSGYDSDAEAKLCKVQVLHLLTRSRAAHTILFNALYDAATCTGSGTVATTHGAACISNCATGPRRGAASKASQ